MTEYTFSINGEYKTAKVDTEEEALKEADIEEEQEYSLVDADIVTLLFKREKLLIHGIIINSNT
jgi:hypothetical protein